MEFVITFLEGFISFISPCMLPLLPLYVSYFAGGADKKHKPVVINFWATWCPPCKRELPDFDRLCREYGDRVVFMMVNLTDGRRDTVDGTKKFVSEKGYTFPVYFDTGLSGAKAYSVSSIPQTTFIDANGNVFATRIGAMNETVLRSYINAILGG